MDDRTDEWQEGPGLVESMRRYKRLAASITLLAVLAALVWSSTQPVLYQGVVRIYLANSGDQADPGRMVRSQAQYLTSPEVLDRTLALDGNRMSRQELQRRLTVQPASDSDVITITVLDVSREQAGALAESVASAYRESVARQSAEAARRAVASLNQREKQLAAEIATLDRRLSNDPGNQMLLTTRQAKQDQLAQLAAQVESTRDSAAAPSEPVRESATVPEDPAQPKLLRNAALAALVGLVISAGLAWWLNGRRVQKLRSLESPPDSGDDEAHPDPKGEPEPTQKAEPEPTLRAEPESKTESGPLGKPEPEATKPERNGEPGATTNGVPARVKVFRRDRP